MDDLIDDLFILRLIRAGDRLAFKHLFELYFAPLCRFVHLYIKKPEAAEDIVLDIFTDMRSTESVSCLFCGVRNKIPEIGWCIGYEGKAIPDMEVRHITHLNTGISRFYKILLGNLSNFLI